MSPRAAHPNSGFRAHKARWRAAMVELGRFTAAELAARMGVKEQAAQRQIEEARSFGIVGPVGGEAGWFEWRAKAENRRETCADGLQIGSQ